VTSIYLQNPLEEKTYKFVLQVHIRGKSVHLDFRYELEPRKVLLGWTIDAIKSLESTPKDLADAKRLAEKKMSKFIKKCHDSKTKWVTQTKSKEPYEWIGIDNQTFKPGTIGATKNEFGYMWIIDSGIIEYGTQKPVFNELFCHGTKKWKDQTIWNGRFIVRALPNIWQKKSLASGEVSKTGKGYLVYMSFFADPFPYALDSRAIKKHWYPPTGISALPREIRNQIPSEYQYWKIKEQSKAHKIRDELIGAIKMKEVSLNYAENSIVEEQSTVQGHLSYLREKKPEMKTTIGGVVTPWEVKIDKVKVPSKSVLSKIKSTLFYDPPKSLRFWWNPGKGTYGGKDKKGKAVWNHCSDCIFLASKSPFTIDTLPTYPGEGKILCKGADHPSLEVEFPGEKKGEGRHYVFLPVKDKNLYKSQWVIDATTNLLIKDKKNVKIKSMWGVVHSLLLGYKELLKSLVVDAGNMNIVDKAFMVFAGQPLIKDFIIAYEQAVREVLRSVNLSLLEMIALDPAKRAPLMDKADAIAARLLNEGQALGVAPITKALFNSIASQIKALKVFTKLPKRIGDVGVVPESEIHLFPSGKMQTPYEPGIFRRIINSCFYSARVLRSKTLADRITAALVNIDTFKGQMNYDTLRAGKFILDEVDYFKSFWKDCVLIYAPGVSIRNMADNTLKAMNESLNSFFKGEFFWPLMRKRGTPIIPIPKEVSGSFFVKTEAELSEMLGKTNWYQTHRNVLYEALLGGPETKAREWYFSGYVDAYAKRLFKQGEILDDFAEIMREKGIKEVNRVFFDYKNKMAAEVGFERIFPFFTFNIRNNAYWLKDFMYHPWKLGAIRGVWNWWSKRTGSNVNFSIKTMIPVYLIPGTYFNPLSWLSAYKYIKVFTKYHGEPKWREAQDANIKGQIEMMKKIPVENRTKIFSKAKIKNMQDYLDRQKVTWAKVTVDFLDDWLGLLPIWKKYVLAPLQLAEKEEWRTVIPQGQLVDAVSSWMFKEFVGTVTPPGPQKIHYIYGIMDRVGLPTKEMIDEEIKKMSPSEKEGKSRSELAKKVKRAKAEQMYRAWEAQKAGIGFLSGLWLSRSWADVYNMHIAILDELSSKK